MYYGDKRESKVNIAMKLQTLGWDILGFTEDKSDFMTDYYCPASWGGIATKNGYTLCVDISNYNLSNSGREVFSYNSNTIFNANISDKITKLEAMTVENGATEAEEQNAKRMIENIKESAEQQAKEATEQREKSKVLLYKYPEFMANPKACNWHVEKDGKIYAKGKGAFQFHGLPSGYNITDNNYIEYNQYRQRKIIEVSEIENKETQKEIYKFLTFVHKIDNIAIGTANMGDGTEETETEGIEAEKRRGYELKTVTETKTFMKMCEVQREYFQVGDYLTMQHHGHYWKITNGYMRKGTWKINGESVTEERKAFTYEIVGSEKRGYQPLKNPKRYYQWEKELLKGLAEGKTKIYELKEVTEQIEVEKWVKIDNSKPQTNSENKKEKQNNTTESEQVETLNHEYTITEDIDTRNNTPLWVMKITDKMDKSEYIRVSNLIKKIGGYYSKFKHGFIFKANPSEQLEGLANGTITQVQNTANTVNTLEKNQQIADNIEDISTNIIIDLKLDNMEYISNEQYKNKLAEYLTEHKITITDGLLSAIAYDDLKSVLTAIRAEQEQQKQREQQEKENTVLLEKINKNIDSLQKKIDALSGNYKTNTYKRMNEQASRDSKKESYSIDIKILEYVKDKILNNEAITELEKGLTVGAFRDTIHSYHLQHEYFTKTKAEDRRTTSREIKYPQIDYTCPLDGWYNKEVPQKQSRLKKYGITDTRTLIQAVEEYAEIYNNRIDRGYINPTERKIIQLEREFKLLQKGDVNFTPSEIAEELVQYARIDNNSRVLEPSAGIAKIADEIKKVTEYVDVCESSYQFSELLELKGYNIVGNDFLQYEKQGYYDAIIMNPPFSKNQDITHLQHAYKLLKNNGTLVCITSPHWQFANDKASQDFRKWLEYKDYFVKELEAKTFEMTGVVSRIVVIEKNEEEMKEVI